MEDDAVLSDILLDYLRESWDVDYAYNSEEVYTLLEKNSYDLFIFDINVSGKSGVELLEELREFSDTTPTIFITAYRDTEHLKRAFDAGAHDYIKKPFELEELNARILNTKKTLQY
jgi:DNA-binding response OmpR family regulator